MAKPTRDYAKKPKKSKAKRNVRKGAAQKSAQTPFGLWAFVTLLLVVLAAGFVYVSMLDKNPKRTHSHKLSSAKHSKKIQAKKRTISDKPRFEFYNILPNSSVSAESTSRAPHKIKHHYDVQVSSTKIKKQAERLRARLILHGLEAHVTRIKTSKHVWYRVSLGPYTSRTDAEAVLKKLRQNDVDGLIHRMD